MHCSIKLCLFSTGIKTTLELKILELENIEKHAFTKKKLMENQKRVM